MSQGDPFSRFEHEGWQRVATRYERAWSSLTRAFIPALLDAAGIDDGMRVLDVACGPGYVAEAALARSARSIGIDFSAEMIKLACARNRAIPFLEGDAQALSFPRETFDVVVMNFGLLHLSKPQAAFEESFRVLRLGGRYAFSVWAGPEESPGAKLVEDAVTSHADLGVSLPAGPEYFAYSSPPNCRNAVVSAGYDSESFRFQTFTEKWRVPTASFVFESERHAGVRTAALLARQTDIALAAIKEQIETGVRKYKQGDGYAVPFAAHVVTVQKTGVSPS